MEKSILLKEYKEREARIKQRLNDFKRFYSENVSWFYVNGEMHLLPSKKHDNERIFEELCFCILTANTSAVIGMKAVDALRDVIEQGGIEDISLKLRESGYRFPNIRARFIFEARQKFMTQYGMNLKGIIESFSNIEQARDFFANEVKGLGYKEASHFLRNIGVFGFAILDKHILRTMHEFGLIEDVPKSLTKKRYLEIEKKLFDFSNKIGIPIDELDLLLWSMKTGKIMK